METEDSSNAIPDEMDEPKPKSFFSRMAGVYTSPRAAFQEIGQAPRVFVPYVCLILLSLLAGIFLSRMLDMESAAVSQMELLVQRGTLTKQQMEQALPMAIRMAGIQVIIGTAFVAIIGALVVAGYAKLFSLMVTAENRFKSLFSVSVYAMLAISIVQYAVTIPILLLKGPGGVDITQTNSIIASNLGSILSSFFGADILPKFIMGLARGIDIFAIWMIALLAIGYSMVSRRLKTSTAAIWLGGAYALLIILSAAASAIFSPGN